jgi:hypothetical protein
MHLDGAARALSRCYAEHSCAEIIQVRLLLGQVGKFHACVRVGNCAHVGRVQRLYVLLR